MGVVEVGEQHSVAWRCELEETSKASLVHSGPRSDLRKCGMSTKRLLHLLDLKVTRRTHL